MRKLGRGNETREGAGAGHHRRENKDMEEMM